MEEKDFENFARRWVGPKEDFKLIVKYWNAGILNGEEIQRIHNPFAFSLQVLFDLLEDKNPEIRRRAAEVLSYRKEETAYDAIINVVKKEEGYMKNSIEMMLKKREERTRIDVVFRIPAEAARQITQSLND